MDDLLDFGESGSVLDSVNYRVTDNAGRRRSSLQTGMRKHGASIVIRELNQMLRNENKSYKKKRLKRDISFLENAFNEVNRPIL